jgi:capsular exopolysaccharide synthesis family protein
VNEKIYSILLEKREEVRIAEAGRAGDVKLVDAAQEPVSPIKPTKAKNLAFGLFFGLSLGVGLAFFSESLDTSLKSQQDVEEYMNLPVLVAIPAITPNGATRAAKQVRKAERSYGGRLLCHLEAGSHVYEAYRSLQTKFTFNGKHALKSILVTSPNAAEGKTLTAINMAQAFARSGIKTLLVDCDLRHPMIHQIFGIERELGLSDVLRNQCVSIEKVAKTWAVQMRDNANMFVFPCGTLPPNPYEILNTPRMREVLTEFKRRYDLVILDSPPLMAATDSVVVGNEVDAVCLVIKSGKTSRDEAFRAQELLENAQTNVIGTILNGIDVKKNGKGRYKSDYYIN